MDNLFWRRLHSLTGFMPLGGFLLFHLYENSYSAFGAAAYDAHVKGLRDVPGLLLLEITFIYIPLLYHALYGLYIWYTGKGNWLQYPYARKRLYTLQRITGAVGLVFVAYHIYDQRLRDTVAFANVHESIARPLVLALYIIGVAALSWHMWNGIWNALIKWGVTVGPRPQKLALYVCMGLGICLVAWGIRALMGFM